ncbi:MAG TPA: EAL domain-containing protein [Gemmatimonadota bacterium]|nr:EAL domain-containing protein [Gemmatimonadota bacterium]
MLHVGAYSFGFVALGRLLTSVAVMGLGTWVLVSRRRASVGLYFFLLTLVVVARLLTSGLVYAAPDAGAALRWTEVAFLAIPFVPTAFYRFTVEALEIAERRRVWIGAMLALSAASVVLVVATDVIVAGVRRAPHGWAPTYGSPGGLPLLLFVLGGLLLSLGEFWRAWRAEPPGPERERLGGLLAALAVGALAAVDFLPYVGVPIPPAGFLAVLAAVVLMARTITRYELVRLTPSFAADKVFETLTDAVLVCDASGRIHVVNPAAAHELGRPARELRGRRLEDAVAARDGERGGRGDGVAARLLAGDGVRDREVLLARPDGSRRASVSSAPLRGVDGDTVGWVVVARTMEQRLEALRAMRESQEKFSRVFQANPLAMAITALEDEVLLEVNEAFTEFFGYAPEEAVGRTPVELGVWVDPEDRARVVREVLSHGRSRGSEVRMVTRSGEVRDVLFFAEEIEVAGQPCLLGAVYDLTGRKAMERELERQALHDGLTGLANRNLFDASLEHACQGVQRGGGRVAIIYMDLDDFKRVNDALGHAAGDQLLAAIGRRLESALRGSDLVARIGGDEFTVLLERLESSGSPTEVAGRLLSALRSPFELRDTTITVTASAGIAVSGDGIPARPADLLRFADVAMYRAKVEGGDRARSFDPAVDSSATVRLQRENELRAALGAGQIGVQYQPVLEIEGGRVAGAEALARWDHPERGRLPPAEFIPLAEESGLIVALGRTVLERAAAALARWHRGGAERSLDVSVNLSAREFLEGDLVEWLSGLVERTGLPPRALILEITERAILQGGERIERLRRLGFRIAVDDFGIGYSSLAYLRDLPVDILKLDRSFVQRLGERDRDAAIVATVVSLAHELDLVVVAEGVETEIQHRTLLELGCRYAQGFHYHPAVGEEEVAVLLG